MPSPIGHLLAGAAIGLAADHLTRRSLSRTAATDTADHESAARPAAEPEAAGRRGRPAWVALALTCAVLAALADIDLLYQPIHRQMTHSVAAAALVTIIAAGVTGWVTRRDVWRTALVCGAAYASHLLLDWMGADSNPPQGIRALWPFSDAWFISGWDLFARTERRGIFTLATLMTNARAALQEIAIVGPAVAAAWWWRRRRPSMRGTARVG